VFRTCLTDGGIWFSLFTLTSPVCNTIGRSGSGFSEDEEREKTKERI
jgi:hypothetical protein